MLNSKYLLSFFFCFLFNYMALPAAHFEHMVNLTIRVEDASFNLRIKEVKFNNENVSLNEPDNFKPRTVLTYKLAPGRYMLIWSTEKGVAKRSQEPVTNHERILVLESGDMNVRVNIKGDSITLY